MQSAQFDVRSSTVSAQRSSAYQHRRPTCVAVAAGNLTIGVGRRRTGRRCRRAGLQRGAVGQRQRIVEPASGQHVVDRGVARGLGEVRRRFVAGPHLVSRRHRPAGVNDRSPPRQRRHHQPVVHPGTTHHEVGNSRPRQPGSLGDEVVLRVLQRRCGRSGRTAPSPSIKKPALPK